MGIWCEPDLSNCYKSDTAIVFVTAGMLHNAGPFRLHVDLANRLLNLGIPSLRFDVSGIGESLAIGSEGKSIDRAAEEIHQAIDWIVETKAIEKVALFGLCSGADDAIHAAVTDTRVTGVVAMDGCGYRTPLFYWYRFIDHYGPRLKRFAKWRDMIGRNLKRTNAVPESLQAGTDIREFPPQKVSERQLLSLANRDVRLHFVYTGGVGEYYNHDTQFNTMFPALSRHHRVSHRYFPALDHVAFLCEDRRKLVEHVACKMSWMCGEKAASRQLSSSSIELVNERENCTPWPAV